MKYLKRFFYATIMTCCLVATYVVVQDSKDISVNADATQFLNELKPHVNKYAKAIVSYVDKKKK